MKIDKDGIWIVGDVHGEYEKLLKLIEKLPKNVQICFVGDLIDRGEKSAEVVELILSNDYFCVLGNHELMMIKSVKDKQDESIWQSNGGKATLRSYDKYDNNILTSHMVFLESLPYFFYFDVEYHKPLVVSHSYIHHVWIDEKYKYSQHDSEDILWRHMYKKEYFDRDKEIQSGIFNIFGHSPVREVIVTDTYAMIDTGATYKSEKNLEDGFGNLSAIHYPSLKIISVF
jgi:serine/threonine protein phosphatase 1